jgi:putative PIN family toxin of toxin-antitoxin system
MKIVFDSNVYLAATKPKSYAREQLERSGFNGPYKIYISPEIITEVREVLEPRFFYESNNSANFIDMILLYATLVQSRRRVTNVLNNTDDHIILECAIEAKAQTIVTAYRGLLRLKEFEDIAIIHPTMLQYLK